MTAGLETEENMLSHLQVQVIAQEQVSEQQLREFIAFFKAGYGDRWVSEDHFRKVVMRNSTELLTMRSGGQLVAAFNFDHHRITDIAVSPKYRGEGLGVRLFQEAVKYNTKAWITIATDADAMLATITSQELEFLPVEDQGQIEALFKQCNGTRENYQVSTTEVKLPWLAKRLEQKGIKHAELFVASSRTKSLHGSTYQQIIFQNQG